ncbi:MAG: GGDEF domain-containing protein [Pseudohongiella sp.]|nr:GGDEF domain-containing protein [Pseudohongiella sp.]
MTKQEQKKFPRMLGAAASDQAFYSRVMMVVTLCGVTTGIPFAIYHLVWGNSSVGLVLFPVLLLQALSVFLLLRNGFNMLAAWIIGVSQTSATVFYTITVGIEASYWLFASGVANYYILDRRGALALNLVVCALTVMLALNEPSLAIRFIATFLMINVFLFSFSKQLESKNKELDRMLTVDPLTLAGNRTALEESLRRVKSQFDRHKVPVSLIMIDLDHFKEINDAHGHSEGDEVLKRIARLVQNRLRPTDHLYRFGGEEFIVITENTHMDQAAFLAEDIRKRVEAQSDDAVASKTRALTISSGLAQLRADESADEWLARADKAMYKAKAMGRNWICFDAGEDLDQLGKSSGMAVAL